MTYNKYTYFLMYEDGEEYDTAYKAGTRAPFTGVYYCEACGGSITSIGSQPLPSDIIFTRRRKAQSDGDLP